MLSNNRLGPNYKKIVEAAMENHTAGPQYHMHDKHYKKWLEKNPPKEEVVIVEEPKQKVTKPKKIKEKVKEESIVVCSISVGETKPKEQAQKINEAALKIKYEQQQRQKFLDTLKPHCRCDYIKSVGNGL